MNSSLIYTPLFAVTLFFSYLCGAIPFGWLIAKIKGINILEVGSGNIGATNAWRILGWKLGTLVFILDVIKGFLPTYLNFMVFESIQLACFTGILCIVGHSFSPFLNFKGGKGISTGLGVFLGICPIPTLAAFATFGIVLYLFRYVSLASMIASVCLPIYTLLMGYPTFLSVILSSISCLIIFRHRQNIQRIISGTESKILKKNHDKGYKCY